MKTVLGDPCGLNQLERTIAPPMKAAITIPIRESGVVVYVCSSPFGMVPASVLDVKQVAEAVVKGLELYANQDKDGSR